MESEGNVDLPGVEMEGQETPSKDVDVNDPDITQDQSIIASEVPDDPYLPTEVSTLATEGTCRSTIVRSQPDTYAPSMVDKR